jgi:hypothetical protein
MGELEPSSIPNIHHDYTGIFLVIILGLSIVLDFWDWVFDSIPLGELNLVTYPSPGIRLVIPPIGELNS